MGNFQINFLSKTIYVQSFHFSNRHCTCREWLLFREDSDLYLVIHSSVPSAGSQVQARMSDRKPIGCQGFSPKKQLGKYIPEGSSDKGKKIRRKAYI